MVLGRQMVTRVGEIGLSYMIAYRRGLADRSRAPQRIPHKTAKEVETRVIELRRSYPAWGPERLKLQF